MSAASNPLLRLALDGAARRAPDAVLLAGDGLELHAGALGERVADLQARLHCEGPVLASRLDNGIEALLVELAAQAGGQAALSLPPYFTPDQFRRALDQSGARTLVLAPGARPPGSDWQPDDALRWPGLRLWRRVAPAGSVRLPDGTACITYTSGSTGTPKGVCLSAEHLATVAHALSEAFESLQPRRHLSVLPVSTLLETVGVYAALGVGARVDLPGLASLGYSGAAGLDPRRLRAVFDAVQPDSAILVPQLLDGLLAAIALDGPLRRAPALLAVGGARVSPRLLERAAAAGLSVYEGYGLSEAGSVVCLNRPGAVQPGSVGRPLPHQRVRVDASGELLIEGPRFLGYLGAEPPPPGALRSGDTGRVDAAGRVVIEGRRSERFITSYGRNVSPAWVEGELLAEPEIPQALVLGEARPWNLALLWSPLAGSDPAALLAAVRRANARLPDYARIGGLLHLAAPLSAADGSLTGNGRPRRELVLTRFASDIERAYAQGPDPRLDPLLPSHVMETTA